MTGARRRIGWPGAHSGSNDFAAVLRMSGFSGVSPYHESRAVPDSEGRLEPGWPPWCDRSMPLVTYRPPPPLCDFVDVMWHCEDFRPGHAKERILPDGRMALVIHLGEDRLRLYESKDSDRFRTVRGSMVTGAHADYHVIDTDCQQFMVGVHFKPGRAFPFFALPADELSGYHAPLDELWGVQASALRERLLEASGPAPRFRILDQLLLSKLQRSAPGHPAVAFALKRFQEPTRPSLAEVRTMSGLSERRFIEVFRAEVGLTPKVFCRILRFQDALKCLEARQALSWAQLALCCGYYDQAHFIHDFRAFCGLNPSAYLAQRGAYLKHLPIES